MRCDCNQRSTIQVDRLRERFKEPTTNGTRRNDFRHQSRGDTQRIKHLMAPLPRSRIHHLRDRGPRRIDHPSPAEVVVEEGRDRKKEATIC